MMIRVLIVDDSVTSREYLKILFENAPDFTVAGAVKGGREALTFLSANQVDIISLDIEMPGMDGYETSRQIMEKYPLPIVMVSGAVDPNDMGMVFKALECGVLEVVAKPAGGRDVSAERLLSTFRRLAKVDVSRSAARFSRKKSDCKISSLHRRSVELVVVGASTGGPPVLKTILSPLSADYSLPILVVQHITPGFLEGMVNWLDTELALSCRIARDGEGLEPGVVYFAPDKREMMVSRSRRICLKGCGHGSAPKPICPSVAELFQSALEEFGSRCAAVLLTGMGRDGAAQLKKLRDAGAVTVAQDRESCVVFGMPGEAIRLGGVEHCCNPEQIGDFLLSLHT